MLGEGGKFLRKWATKGDEPGQLDRPHAITIDSKGNLYVASHRNTRIQKFDPQGKLLLRWDLPNPSKSRHEPTAIHFDKQDRLFVPDTGNHRILVYDTQGKLLMTFGKQGKGDGQFDRPNGLALDDRGFLYVCDSGNQRIQKFQLQVESALTKPRKLTVKLDPIKSITNPPCSYCITQHRSGFIKGDDRVVTWLRGGHNGGAIPLRHFLSGPRVINDTYGIFFYDPDGGYVAAYEKSPGYKVTYEFYGWRDGVMVVKGSDGILRSALSGEAIDGPENTKRLRRIPSMVTNWQYWLMLHPESVAYKMFDGKKYTVAPLPKEFSQEAKESMGGVDDRLKPMTNVLGVEIGGKRKAYPLEDAGKLACFTDTIDGQPIAVFWYGSTRTAVAFSTQVDGQQLEFYEQPASPETAPYKDRGTQTRWTLAGRAVDGRLRGKQLKWVDSIQCHWYAWSAEFPETELYEKSE
ncbi:MAG TPA: DUF3179 domain-containing (seleno)protein [Pirellulaceae bacterium]|nr:DUF3179 domain-containing (seleno)protein [Pirellulaceae bacterium]